MTRLRYERQRRQFSQLALARAAQLNQPDVSEIERGIRIPTREQLQRLADAIGVPPDDLLKEVVVVTEMTA